MLVIAVGGTPTLLVYVTKKKGGTSSVVKM